MADNQSGQAGAGGERGGERGRGGFGAGRGQRRGRGRRGDKKADEWTPVTKLGRLVKEDKIGCLEDIYLYSIPIKEYQIVEKFIKPVGQNVTEKEEMVNHLKDEVLKIMPVQKQTTAGQRTRFKAFVAVGDFNGHLGLGVKCSKEVATAIRGAIILAKLSLIPVRRGYWGGNFGAPHTIPCKVTGKCGSVRVRLIPAPRGTGIVAAGVAKKLLTFAGVDDCFTSACGKTRTLGNFAKAVYDALSKTYCYLTPDLWENQELPAEHFWSTHSAWLQQGGGLKGKRPTRA